MGNVDIEIYLTQFISFFDKNPDDLVSLIGDIDKKVFYDKVKERCYMNVDEGKEISLTKQQMIDILVELNGGSKKGAVIELDKVFEKTNYGYLGLN
jgi:hypothetical protein